MGYEVIKTHDSSEEPCHIIFKPNDPSRAAAFVGVAPEALCGLTVYGGFNLAQLYRFGMDKVVCKVCKQVLVDKFNSKLDISFHQRNIFE